MEWVFHSIPSPWDLPDPRIEPGSPALQADYLPAELTGKPYCPFQYGVLQQLCLESIDLLFQLNMASLFLVISDTFNFS